VVEEWDTVTRPRSIPSCRRHSRPYFGQVDQSAGGVMDETVNLYQAKTHLSRLVERAAKGEEIIIAKGGKPKAKLVPDRAATGGQNPATLLGISFIFEDSDEPLPPEMQSMFEAS